MRTSLHACVLAAVLVAVAAAPGSILVAPYSPTMSETTLDVSQIPGLAKYDASVGVTHEFVGGGMGQFFALNITERKALFAAWASAASEHKGMNVVANIGDTSLQRSVELGIFAVDHGIKLLGIVPPYYSHPRGEAGVMDWLQALTLEITKARPDAPKKLTGIVYYHIPGSSGVNVSVHRLLQTAATRKMNIPIVAVKYVSGDTRDYYLSRRDFGKAVDMMWAPEPKIQGLGLGAESYVMAESFYTPNFRRLYKAYESHVMPRVWLEQDWKYNISSVFSAFGGDAAKHAVYQKLAGVDLGHPRLPDYPMDQKNLPKMYAALTSLRFFSQPSPDASTSELDEWYKFLQTEARLPDLPHVHHVVHTV